MIGTAPRRPTQETYTLALVLICLKGARHKKTLMGRARMIMKKPTNKPSPAMGSKSRGLTSKPKVRNMTIWKSQVNPSKKVVTLFLC